MTLDIHDGWAVAVPNAELFPPYREMNSSGGWYSVPGSVRPSPPAHRIANTRGQDRGAPSWALEDGSLPAAPDKAPIVHLGAPFPSQAYLGVDYDAESFFLAPIRRDDGATSSTELRGNSCGDDCWR